MGDLGLEILQARMRFLRQNDVLMYGAGFSYPVHKRVTSSAK